MMVGRHTAVISGLMPTDEMDAAMTDSIATTTFAMVAQFAALEKIEDAAEKQQKGMELAQAKLIPYVKGLEKILGEKPYFFGDELTCADLLVYHVFKMMLEKAPEPAAPMIKMLFGKIGGQMDKIDGLDFIKQLESS